MSEYEYKGYYITLNVCGKDTRFEKWGYVVQCYNGHIAQFEVESFSNRAEANNCARTYVDNLVWGRLLDDIRGAIQCRK